MVDRYQRPQFKKIWNDETKFQKFLTIELECLKAQTELGLISNDTLQEILHNAKFDLNKIKEYEDICKHDVIAFTQSVGDSIGENKKWFHYGLTSTDIVDSALSLQFVEANKYIEQDIEELSLVLLKQAKLYKDTPIMGRTHGMHAEVTSFGLKWLLWYDELVRAKENFLEARKEIEIIKLSGAVGNYEDIDPRVEQIVAKNLNLPFARISTQVVSRDRHARYIESLVAVSNLLEKIAFEIRNLSRQEIKEVEEPFGKLQKGSSAMPHKRNPITSENICGCGRVMRSYIGICLENNLLWHERDISHSSAERIVFCDATSLLDYMLTRYTKLLDNLVVYKEKMMDDINLTKGICFSNSVLRKLIQKGWDRYDAYEVLQKCAFDSLNTSTSFLEVLNGSVVRNTLSKEELESCFDISKALENCNVIYKRFE